MELHWFGVIQNMKGDIFLISDTYSMVVLSDFFPRSNDLLERWSWSLSLPEYWAFSPKCCCHIFWSESMPSSSSKGWLFWTMCYSHNFHLIGQKEVHKKMKSKPHVFLETWSFFGAHHGYNRVQHMITIVDKF